MLNRKLKIPIVVQPSVRGHSKMTSRTQGGVGVSEIVTKRDRNSRGGG